MEAAFDDLEVQLFAEGKGIFDVKCEGKLLFSKYEVDRFPAPGEITQQLKGMSRT